MNLLSANDFDALQRALRRGDELRIVRQLRDLEVTVQTCPVTYPWTVSMIIQVQVKRGQYSWTQNFETVEEAKQGLKKGYGIIYEICKVLGGT